MAGLAGAGALPQRLLWASTGTKDPQASDVLYVRALAAPDTIDTMPEDTLNAFADHGAVDAVLPADGGDAEDVLAQFGRAGIDAATLAAELQREGAVAFDKSGNELIDRLKSKCDVLERRLGYGRPDEGSERGTGDNLADRRAPHGGR